MLFAIPLSFPLLSNIIDDNLASMLQRMKSNNAINAYFSRLMASAESDQTLRCPHYEAFGSLATH